MWVTASGLLLAASCTPEPTDETPSGTVRLFLESMERSDQQPQALREAYELLSEPTRERLQERAHLAGSLGGQELAPWEMIVSGRYRQSFTVAQGSGGMQESIDGDRAVVRVRAEEGSRSAEVPLVREDGRWRIVIPLGPARGAR